MRPKFSFCLLLFFLVMGGGVSQVSAQKWAVKSNLAYDATASINLGVEVALADRWTLDLSGNYNPFTINKDTNMKWKHWLVQPEARYWFCHKFGGNFLAMHLWGGEYNVGNVDFKPNLLFLNAPDLSNYRYQGYFAGAGVGYGYAFMLGNHWNLELEVGVGCAYTWYDKYYCAKCGSKLATDEGLYWGITKLAFNLVYVF